MDSVYISIYGVFQPANDIRSCQNQLKAYELANMVANKDYRIIRNMRLVDCR
jgi:hypothetical protein